MVVNIASIIAVIGAWVAGLSVITSVYCFCFSTIKLQLLRYGLIFLFLTDIGLITMIVGVLIAVSSGSNAFPGNDATTVIAFSAAGLVALVALTIAALVIVRIALARNRTVNAFEQTRKRLEF